MMTNKHEVVQFSIGVNAVVQIFAISLKNVLKIIITFSAVIYWELSVNSPSELFHLERLTF